MLNIVAQNFKGLQINKKSFRSFIQILGAVMRKPSGLVSAQDISG